MANGMKDSWANGAGPGGGLGTRQGSIAGPNEGLGYDIKPAGSMGPNGGSDIAPFSGYKESPTNMPTATCVSLGENLGTDGAFESPMSTSAAIISGSKSSDGTGAQGGGISTPFINPFPGAIGKGK